MVAELISKGFDPDPVKRWKAAQVTNNFKLCQYFSVGTFSTIIFNINQEEKLDLIVCFQISFQAKEEKEGAASDDSDVDSDVEEDAKDADYDYLLGMAMWSLTSEKKAELLKKKDDKHKELDQVNFFLSFSY
jgi:uncharacterized pyridoxal phosphate-containing UPF0001 family protein